MQLSHGSFLPTAPRWIPGRSWRSCGRPTRSWSARWRGCWAPIIGSPWTTSCRSSCSLCPEPSQWNFFPSGIFPDGRIPMKTSGIWGWMCWFFFFPHQRCTVGFLGYKVPAEFWSVCVISQTIFHGKSDSFYLGIPECLCLIPEKFQGFNGKSDSFYPRIPECLCLIPDGIPGFSWKMRFILSQNSRVSIFYPRENWGNGKSLPMDHLEGPFQPQTLWDSGILGFLQEFSILSRNCDSSGR